MDQAVRSVTLAFAAVAALASPPAGATPEEVVRTEASFEADARRLGIGRAFAKNVARDGVMFLPDPVRIRERPELVDWQGELLWRPNLIIASLGNDVYVSTGPAVFVEPGGARSANAFVTLWERQADGSLKFRLDRGVPQAVDQLLSDPPTARFRILRGSASPARPDPRRLEADYAASAKVDARLALARFKHPEGRWLRAGHRPTADLAPEAVAGALPLKVDYKVLETGYASSHDLAWAYGTAAWQDGENVRTGYYFRTWIFDGERWVIALDDLTA